LQHLMFTTGLAVKNNKGRLLPGSENVNFPHKRIIWHILPPHFQKKILYTEIYEDLLILSISAIKILEF
jgi:hypothetical protein